MINNTTCSRRDFLKSIGALCGTLWLPPLTTAPSPYVAVPPSLMVHSRDGRIDFLPPLLEELNELGYTGTTYQEWQRCISTGTPIARPVILSIDDISAAAGGCPAFATYARMKSWLRAAGMTAVYGVITEPVYGGKAQRDQDEARWDLLQDWVEEGFELATHTSYHSNFNARDSGPRSDFTTVDYEAEICRSTELITVKLADRGLSYRVRSLILPYGSGYAYRAAAPYVHTGILDACRRADIQFVVGIAHGREPVPRARLHYGETAVYVGRIPPAYTAAAGKSVPSVNGTLAQLAAWQQHNESQMQF